MKLEITVNVFLHPCSDSEKLEQILQQLNRLTKATQQEESQLSDLTDAIDALEQKTSAESNQITAGEGLLSQISQLYKDALAAGGDQAAIVARIQAVNAAVDAKTSEFAAAIVANTPAAPTPAPTSASGQSTT